MSSFVAIVAIMTLVELFILLNSTISVLISGISVPVISDSSEEESKICSVIGPPDCLSTRGKTTIPLSTKSSQKRHLFSGGLLTPGNSGVNACRLRKRTLFCARVVPMWSIDCKSSTDAGLHINARLFRHCETLILSTIMRKF